MNMNEQIKMIVNKIPKLEEGKRFIIGIDGLSRSGKTTLVKHLSQLLTEEKLPYYVFHIDDHIVERNRRYNTGHEEWFEYYQLQWDIQGLRDQLFEKIKGSQSFNLSFYQDELDTQMTKQITLPQSCVVIIEGVFLQRKEWRNYYDFLLYLDCPRDKRFLRESQETQKNLLKFENRYWLAENFYLETERPLDGAYMVLHG
ncbi:kinase [Neobacillus rhizosphaerae]|uniref:kinase n=1 Tax=Neobacillus rhizosphaerae TaxID=2880965 RepID=UPI003D2C4B48